MNISDKNVVPLKKLCPYIIMISNYNWSPRQKSHVHRSSTPLPININPIQQNPIDPWFSRAGPCPLLSFIRRPCPCPWWEDFKSFTHLNFLLFTVTLSTEIQWYSMNFVAVAICTRQGLESLEFGLSNLLYKTPHHFVFFTLIHSQTCAQFVWP
jgi:hypothetical protein